MAYTIYMKGVSLKLWCGQKGGGGVLKCLPAKCHAIGTALWTRRGHRLVQMRKRALADGVDVEPEFEQRLMVEQVTPVKDKRRLAH